MRGSRFFVLIVALAVAAAGLLFVWRSIDAVERIGAIEPDVVVEPVAPPSSDATSLSAVDAPELTRAQPVDAVAANVASGDATESFPLEGARWIEGVVKFPAGTPADERVEVWALRTPVNAVPGARFAGDVRDGWTVLDMARTNPSGNTWSHRPVAADGTFRVPMAADAKLVMLCIDARYLYLAETVGFAAETAAQPVELAPLLGACIAVECAPPAGADASAIADTGSLADAKATLGGVRTSSRGTRPSFVQTTRDVASDGTVEFGGFPPGLRYEVTVVAPALAPGRADEIETKAGRRTVVRVPLLRGARVAGRVRDEAGSPIAGAKVYVDEGRRLPSRFAPPTREATTAADGTFTLAGLTPGKLRVTASLDGYKDAQSDEVEALDGALRENVEIVLTRGLSLSGRVTWDDGRPVAGAHVIAIGFSPRGATRRSWSDPYEADTDANGAFTIQGLGEGEFMLDASIAAPAGAVTDRPALWTATSEKVEAGAADVVLVLAAPGDISARVVDETGAAVTRFRARADMIGETAPALSPEVRSIAATPFEAPDGRFTLRALRRGRWNVKVEADGYTQIEKQDPIAVPQEGADLTITLHRAGSVAGRVLDPSGAPVARARVSPRAGGESRPFAAPSANSSETDAEGRFALDKVPPGRVDLVATHETWAASAPTSVELRPSARVEDVVLTLRAGGRLTGEIYDARGEPVAGRNVHVFSIGASDMRQLKSDAGGRFEADHLTPGAYQVIAEPTAEEQRAMEARAREGDVDPADFLGRMKVASVTIEDGQTAHVVLGAPPKAPVRLFGRVTRGGKPAAGLRVSAVGDGKSMLEDLRSTRADASGHYELTLGRPGDVSLIVSKQDEDAGGVEFQASVPEAPEFELDLALPSGGIRGRVLGPQRQPLANVAVDVERAGAGAASNVTLFGLVGGRGRITTDESGAFEAVDLFAGTYTVAAGGVTSRFGRDPNAEHARAVRSGIVVTADAFVEGIELVLAAPGKISGHVKDRSGLPVAGAAVFARDESGEPLDRFSKVATDAAGRFVYPGVAPGSYSVSARTKTLASVESPAVRVRAGETSEIEIAVETGTIVVVSVLDGEKSVRASLSVRDEKGREMASLAGWESIEMMFLGNAPSTEPRIGPLPSGKYTVEATANDGRKAKRTVSLNGQEERAVVLRFD